MFRLLSIFFIFLFFQSRYLILFYFFFSRERETERTLLIWSVVLFFSIFVSSDFSEKKNDLLRSSGFIYNRDLNNKYLLDLKTTYFVGEREFIFQCTFLFLIISRDFLFFFLILASTLCSFFIFFELLSNLNHTSISIYSRLWTWYVNEPSISKV